MPRTEVLTMRRDGDFPVDMPVRWTTQRYRALARVRVGLLDFIRGIKAKRRLVFAGRAMAAHLSR